MGAMARGGRWAADQHTQKLQKTEGPKVAGDGCQPGGPFSTAPHSKTLQISRSVGERAGNSGDFGKSPPRPMNSQKGSPLYRRGRAENRTTKKLQGSCNCVAAMGRPVAANRSGAFPRGPTDGSHHTNPPVILYPPTHRHPPPRRPPSHPIARDGKLRNTSPF